MLDELIKNDIYAKEYGEAFITKIRHLNEIITKGFTSLNEFNVFALEAGLGKSKYVNSIIDDNLNDWDNFRTYLVVKRFKEDVMEMEKALSHHNELGILGERVVLGITSDNWSEWKENLYKLKKVIVLIITHARYIQLCLDEELRQAFTENREVLIIDEKVNFPVYTFSKAYYDKVRSLLPFNIQGDFDKVCKNLLKEVQKQEVENNKNKCVRVKPNIHPKTLENFLQLMEVNIENIDGLDNKNTVQRFIEGLKLWYNTKCLYNGGNISTFNRKHMLWGLRNNIILDASASIDGVYKISNDYHVIEESRIINHTDSNFYFIPFNTSKSSLKNNEEKFYKEIAEKIKAFHRDGEDQTLIICHKDNYKKIWEQLLKLQITDIHIANEPNDEEERNEERVTKAYAINWFGNLIGKNAYADFTQCWVIGTPNIPYEHYPIHYMMYARQEHLGTKSLEILAGKGRFKNQELNEVQVGYIASEIYQSIKRIQRNERPKGDFFIVNNDEVIVHKVLEQMNGVKKIKRINLDFVQKLQKKRKRDNVDKLADYLMKLPVGEYRKGYIAEQLGVSNLNRLLTDSRIKALLESETGYIRIKYRTIEKLRMKND